MAATLNLPLTVRVRYANGAYNTGRVASQTASSTSDAETAMGRLVDKVAAKAGLLPGTLRARLLPAKGQRAGESLWSVEIAS